MRKHLGLLTLLAFPLSAQLFDTNLVINGDAESGPAVAALSDGQKKDVPGWTVTGGFTAAKYDGESLQLSTEAWPNRGKQYFLGGPKGTARSTATQTIALSGSAAEIDAGRVKFYLQAFLGDGEGFDASRATVKAVFQSATNATLLESALRGPSCEESACNQNLFLRATSGYLLPNTRKVQITVDLTNVDGGGDYSQFGADSISLRLTVDEPVIGSNLIANGDAEAGTGVQGCTYLPDSVVPGWNANYAYATVKYGTCDFGTRDPGPKERGNNAFSSYGKSRAWQTVDVTLAKDLVDGGGVTFRFGGWLGGSSDDVSYAVATVAFLGASGNTLSTARIGPVNNRDRNDTTSMLERNAEGPVPSGTRAVRIENEFVYGESTAAGTAYADNLALVLTSGAAGVTITSVANGASLVAGPVAPGEIVAITTTGISLNGTTRMQVDSSGRLTTELAGVKVYFDGTLAPLLSVSSSRITAIAPYDLEGKTSTKIRLEYKGVESNTVSTSVSRTAPGIFSQEETGKGQAEVYNDNWILNSRTNAATPGSVLTVLWTGGGVTFPAGVDGRIETGSLPRPAAEVKVTVGGQAATVVYAGAVPFTYSGLLMAQVKLPASLTGDALALVITAGAVLSPDNAVTITVRQP